MPIGFICSFSFFNKCSPVIREGRVVAGWVSAITAEKDEYGGAAADDHEMDSLVCIRP